MAECKCLNNLGKDSRRLHDKIIQNPTIDEILLDLMNSYKVERCSNRACNEMKNRLNKTAPPCEFKGGGFRTWALKVVSCVLHKPCKQCGGINLNNKLENAWSKCIDLILETDEASNWNSDIDVFGIYWLIYWMAELRDKQRTSRGVPWSEMSRSQMPPKTIQAAYKQNVLGVEQIKTAIQRVSTIGFCQYRLWSLATATTHGIVTLPFIIDALPSFPNQKHQDCTAQACLLGGENSTEKRQLHRRCNGSCDPILCKVEDVGDRCLWILPDNQRDLSNDGQSPGNPLPFMAISHVWLDGTGRGEHSGKVNTCLYSQFQEWAMEQNCKAIWWDAVCLPRGDKKKEALRWMHKNYYDAKIVLVHDLELSAFPWSDDEKPCLALALSTWFTRGWTTLELASAKSEETIKVVFRNATDNRPVVKSLREIFAGSERLDAKPVYKAVSDVIKRVMGDPGKSHDPVSQISAILNPRYTCWLKDRSYIAALLADLDSIEGEKNSATELDPTWNEKKFTQFTIKKAGKISPSSLLHGNVTMSYSGNWSWCPLSIFDMPQGTSKHNMLTVDKNRGTVSGDWEAWVFDSEEMKATPVATHDSVRFRVVDALTSGKNLLVLYPWRKERADRIKIGEGIRFLLVGTYRKRRMGVSDFGPTVNYSKKTVYCEYIGTITLQGRQGEILLGGGTCPS
ncbi:hypothetical protein COCVIDRAFT_17526 [Bipolaris victoriae FI3]|uniref:Heterokaryon incompatibility domain-containing protein n=1 Tax=Bipolaris victoriae (strain FI3) TaxID=930091 RepID=W7E4E3_BIPV3|nr:hypothetical protein COCVIDRAFT_17526 [Bipolaris victoriae FI3]